MYVNSKDGLNQRNAPDLAAEKAGTLLHGERIVVYEKSGNVTIDGITNCRYKTSKILDGHCWVFGGYLSDEMPLDAEPVLGMWDTDKDSNVYWDFTPRREVRSGKKETDIGIYGEWKLSGDTLIINLIPTEFTAYQNNELITIKINVIDKNTIVLTHSDGSVEKLTRNNSGLVR
jgi:hypothetical protein